MDEGTWRLIQVKKRGEMLAPLPTLTDNQRGLLGCKR
jgi:hypothetical protein